MSLSSPKRSSSRRPDPKRRGSEPPPLQPALVLGRYTGDRLPPAGLSRNDFQGELT